MAAVRRLLGVPLADLSWDLVTPLQPEDYAAAAANAPTLVDKLLYGVKRRLSVPVEVICSLLEACGKAQPELLERALTSAAPDSTEHICEAAERALAGRGGQGCAPLPLLRMLAPLCCRATLKESLGAALPRHLLEYMEAVEAHADDGFEVSRSCASLIIELLHSSQANKNRISLLGGKRLGRCVEATGDFYFGMQCVEILFRLHLHNTSAFLAQSTVSDSLRTAIAQLHNDTNLLKEIQALMDLQISEAATPRIHHVDVVHLMAGGAEVGGHVSMYFSRHLLVTVLPGSAGQHFTIPYEHIRSVKLSKDNRLGIRVHVIPEKLALLMSLEEEGKDIIHALLTPAALQRLRSCGVHQWIAERKKIAPRPITRPPVLIPFLPKRDAEEAAGDNQNRVAGVRRPREEAAAEQGVASAPAGGAPSTAEQSQEETARLASRRAAQHREICAERCSRAREGLHAAVERMQRENNLERERMERSTLEDIAAIEQMEASMKSSATEAIESLNAELEQVQALGALLASETEQMRQRLAQAVGAAETVEHTALEQIKAFVDTEVRSLQHTLETMLSQSGPAAIAISCLSPPDAMQTISSRCACAGWRRLLGPDSSLTRKRVPMPANLTLQASRRNFYEKGTPSDSSETSPSGFFTSFGAKNPDATPVPKELHKTNYVAVSHAEKMNRTFLGMVTLLIGGMLYYAWSVALPSAYGFSGRPEGYGVCSEPSARELRYEQRRQQQ
eukprot:gene10748-7476_t